MKHYRSWFRDDRTCWRRGCPRTFTATRADIVYCSATCGRADRGCDAYGRPSPIGRKAA